MSTRFTPSNENLRIAVDDSAVERYIQATARALATKGERKVYFVGFDLRHYPSIETEGAQITVLTAGHEPSNFLKSARILHRDGELVVVSSKRMRSDEWRQIASDVEADVARGTNAV